MCSTCGTTSRKIDISPPGDPFPAMDGHLRRAVDAVNRQFGAGTGAILLPSTKTIVMNKVPAPDAMYEVVIDGYIVGRLRFDVQGLQYRFLLTLEGARRISRVSKEKWVSIHDDVLQYLKSGANLMLPGVAGCDSGIEVRDEVWIIDSSGVAIGAGIARMSGTEMAEQSKGFAVKIREISDPVPSHLNPKKSTWDDAVHANSRDLDDLEDEATSFVTRTKKKSDYLVVVGFSGGKDSLATYLVVEKALKHSPPIFFTDTGIEFPETIDYIIEFARDRGVEIVGQQAKDRFWESLDDFGPPARDFRWCCKVLKLGPAASSIAEHFQGNVLNFMGQRKLESFQRSIEPRVTQNPWVPGQVSAHPIQKWNALEVWLYIFREKAEFNPLYNCGYHRMGCYLCPSSPLAELESIRESHPALHKRWNEKLKEWAGRYGFPEEWVNHGFWRWKNLPKGQMELVKTLGLDIRSSREGPKEQLKLNVVKGVSPCTSAGYSLEGQFSDGIDLNRVSKIFHIFGKTKVSEEIGALRTTAGENTISLFSSGSLIIRGDDDSDMETLLMRVERAVRRAMFCQACGSCIPQCDQGALYLDDDKIAVDEEKCIQCLECDNWPCPTYLS